MKVAIIGKNVKGIEGKHLTFNYESFIQDISPFDVVVYAGEDLTVLKQIVMGIRAASKRFIYIGKLNVEFAQRKLKSFESCESVEKCSLYTKVSTPVKSVVDDAVKESSFLKTVLK